MRSLRWVVALALLTGSAHAEITKWEDGWETCDADRQCVLAQTPCGGFKAVSRAHLKDAKEYFHYQAMLVKCRKLEQMPPPVHCEQQRCTTSEK